MNKGRIVVLGAKGFVAGSLIQRLQKEELSCRPIGRVEVDLADASAEEKLRKILRPEDAVVVTAALTPEHGRDRATFLLNVKMIDSLCGAIANTGAAHIVYISSDSVYDPENDLYGLSHVVREKLLAQVCESRGIPLSTLRCSAIYGALDTHNSYGPNRFLRTAMRDRKITLFGEGEELRDHIYIDDVTHLIEQCLRRRHAGMLNVACGKSLSFSDVAREVIKTVDHAVTLEKAPRSRPVAHRHIDTTALRAVFPEFRPLLFPEGIRKMIACSSILFTS